jgi:uncharacterized protein DUF4124
MRAAFAALLLALPPCVAAGEIVRCVEAGQVTYQDAPCGVSSVGRPAGIASEYPPPNVAERNRLFEREAAMYRRLEARRDRELQEEALRTARESVELERARLAALEAQPPQYLVAYPPRVWARSARQSHPAHRPVIGPGVILR